MPRDAFALRLDLAPLSFEALGNDQNPREVLRDQYGVTEFRFRYSRRAQAGGFRLPAVIAFSRDAACPPLATWARMPDNQRGGHPPVPIDSSRAVATCFKKLPIGVARSGVQRAW